MVETRVTRAWHDGADGQPGAADHCDRHLGRHAALSAFRSKEAIGNEKGALVEALRPDGLAILNADDPGVIAMAKRTQARIVTFGTQEGADYRVIATSDGLPNRLRVTVASARGEFAIETPFLDSMFWLATVAAFACAVELGVAPAEAAQRVAGFAPPWARLGLVEIENGPTFLVDSIKAPAESLAPTFAVLKKAAAERKTIVLGNISDYKSKARKQYRDAYALARDAADRVIFVGENIERMRPTDADRESGAFAGFTPRARRPTTSARPRRPAN